MKPTYRARAVREWATYFLTHGELRPFRRGKFVKTFTIISNEAVQTFIRGKIKELKPLQRSPTNIMNLLNTEWLKEILHAPTKISETTVRRWLYFLDFRPKEKGKNYFVDGHEREDVVQHRNEFLNKMEDLCLRCTQWEGEELEIAVHPVLADGEKRTIFIVQDESFFYTNDSVKLSWLCVNENELRPKASGRALHVSGFACECHGFAVAFVKKVSRHCIRYMDGYRAGLIGPELDYAVKRFRGHRMIPRESIELIKSEFKMQQEKNLRESFKSC